MTLLNRAKVTGPNPTKGGGAKSRYFGSKFTIESVIEITKIRLALVNCVTFTKP